MGFIDLGKDPELRRYIKRRLARRGLKPDLSEEWIVHGPHPGMNYQVFIGPVFDEDGDGFYVVIRPRGVYQIEEPSDWWKAMPEDRIPCIDRTGGR